MPRLTCESQFGSPDFAYVARKNRTFGIQVGGVFLERGETVAPWKDVCSHRFADAIHTLQEDGDRDRESDVANLAVVGKPITYQELWDFLCFRSYRWCEVFLSIKRKLCASDNSLRGHGKECCTACVYKKIGSRPLETSGTSSKGKESTPTRHAHLAARNLPDWLSDTVQNYWDNSWQVLQDDAIRKNPDKQVGHVETTHATILCWTTSNENYEVFVPSVRPGKNEVFLFPRHDASPFGRLAKCVAGCNTTDLGVWWARR